MNCVCVCVIIGITVLCVCTGVSTVSISLRIQRTVSYGVLNQASITSHTQPPPCSTLTFHTPSHTLTPHFSHTLTLHTHTLLHAHPHFSHTFTHAHSSLFTYTHSYMHFSHTLTHVQSLAEESYSGRFGTFMTDCEKMRKQVQIILQKLLD